MDEKIWRNCFLLCACRTQGRHWVHWLLQICKARSIYYSWGRSAQKRPFQYHWKIDKLTSDLYNPESFCLVTRFDNFGWNPFLIFPDLIRITLCSEKIGEAEAVKSKRKEFGLEQSVPLIYIFEALHIFSGKGIWLSRRSIVWLWKESFVKRKLCFWKFLFEPHQPQKNILISLICFHRGATTWSPVFLRWMTRQKEDEQMFTSLDIPLSFTVLIPSKLYYVSASQFSLSNSDKRIKKSTFKIIIIRNIFVLILDSRFKSSTIVQQRVANLEAHQVSNQGAKASWLIGIIGLKLRVVGWSWI